MPIFYILVRGRDITKHTFCRLTETHRLREKWEWEERRRGEEKRQNKEGRTWTNGKIIMRPILLNASFIFFSYSF